MKYAVTSDRALALWEQQYAGWQTMRERYRALRQVRTRSFRLDGGRFEVQFNPARIRSSAACIDSRSLEERKCFLCDPQLPPEQRRLPFGSDYWLMVNPFPIFPRHFTIPLRSHLPQRIAGRYAGLLEMARCLDRFVLFYNGPRCGASAPDHTHFQAGSKGFLPVERGWRDRAEPVPCEVPDACVYVLRRVVNKAFFWESGTAAAAETVFNRLYALLPLPDGDDEPMLNLLVWREADRWVTGLFPRTLHRPSCYSAAGEKNLLLSPASVDMGGVLVLPRESDFEKITESDIRQVFGEVCPAAEVMDAYVERLSAG